MRYEEYQSMLRTYRNIQIQQNYDDLMPYANNSQSHTYSFPKSQMNGKILFFKGMQSKRYTKQIRQQKSRKEFISIQSPILKKQSIILSNLQHYKPTSNEKKPNIYSIQFQQKNQSQRRQTKSVLNNKKLDNKTKYLQTTYKLKSLDTKYKHKNEISLNKSLGQIQTQNPEMQATQKNRFTPRIRKLDYTKPNHQILEKYFQKFNNNKLGKKTSQVNQINLNNFSSISHLQQLQKLREHLLDFQNKIRFNKNMPKLNMNTIDTYDKLTNKNMFYVHQPKKQAKKKIKLIHIDPYDPWENAQDDEIPSSIELVQHVGFK